MKRAIKTCLFSLFFLCSFSAVSKLHSADFTFTITPAVNIPLQEDIPYGFTGLLQSDLNLFGFMTVGLEGNYSIFKPNGFVKPMQLFGGGLDLGFYYYPLSRLYTGLGGGFGINSGIVNVREDGGVYNTYNPTGLYYRGFAELGFRFSPDFILTATGGYLAYVKTDFSNFNNGIYAGIGFKLNKSTGSKRESKSILVTLEQYDDINPSFSRIYRDNECGMITITNHESAEIRNVHIYFDGEKYTNSTISTPYKILPIMKILSTTTHFHPPQKMFPKSTAPQEITFLPATIRAENFCAFNHSRGEFANCYLCRIMNPLSSSSFPESVFNFSSSRSIISYSFSNFPRSFMLPAFRTSAS